MSVIPKKEEPPSPAPLPESPKPDEPKVLADLGKGGAQHKAIQDRIKAEAEALGFRVIVEKQVLGGTGSIDLLLERNGQAIACEVTVTTSIDYEVGNVSKCLKAGYTDIAVVAVDAGKLVKLKAAVTNSLGADKAACVRYFFPDEFIATLRLTKPPAPPTDAIKVSHGYKVKRKVVPLSPEEAKAREEQAIKLIAEMMKRKSEQSS